MISEKISLKDINWDGERISFLIDDMKIKNTKLVAQDRENNYFFEFDYTVENIDREKQYISFSIKELIDRTAFNATDVDFFLCREASQAASVYYKLGKYDVANIEKRLRYYSPIYEVKEWGAVPYLSDNYDLSVKMDYVRNLEKKLYKLIKSTYFFNELLFKSGTIVIKFNDDPSKLSNGKFIALHESSRKEIVLPFTKNTSFTDTSIIIDVNNIRFDGARQGEAWSILLEDKKGSIIQQNYLTSQQEVIRYKQEVSKNQRTPYPSLYNKPGNVSIIPFWDRKNYLSILFGKDDFFYEINRGNVKGQISISELQADNEEIKMFFHRDIIAESINTQLVLLKRNSNDKVYIPLDKNEKNKKGALITQNLLEELSRGRWDIYLDIYYSKVNERKRVGLFQSPIISDKNRFFDPIQQMDDKVIVPYITQNMGLTVLISNKELFLKEKYPGKAFLEKFNMKENRLEIETKVSFKEIKTFNIKGVTLRHRSNNQDEKQMEFFVSKKEGYIKEFEQHAAMDINLKDIPFTQMYWDIYVTVEVEDEIRQLRLKSLHTHLSRKINNKTLKNTRHLDNEYIIYPYITVNKALSLAYRVEGTYEAPKYKMKEKAAVFLYRTLYPYWRKKDIWLIHEKFSETAQDNAYFFFKYCYEEHPDKKVFYVIKKDSVDYKYLKGMDQNVLYFMSIKHLVYLLAAQLIISSESKGHGYAWRVERGPIRKRLDKKRFVFLQHGVLGFKKVDSTFDKKNPLNSAELFVVSSEREKEIVQEYFGYERNEIILTGLPRWDALKDTSHTTLTKEILLMPTWRNWLEEVPEDQFVKSNYYKFYAALLNDDKLQQTLHKNNIVLNFYIHPKFKPYLESFYTKKSNIRIIEYGEEKLNELIMRAQLLITDYSSVAWEMYYLKKNTIFFQFDLNEYIAKQGSYLDLNNELFGEQIFTIEHLTKEIQDNINNDFKFKPKYSNSDPKNLKYTDNQNSKRIFYAIKQNTSQKRKRKNTLSKRMKNKIINTFVRKG